MKTRITTIIAAAAMLLGILPAAQAHVTFVNSRAPAGGNFLATANINHGCEGEEELDTTSVEIVLPDGVTARPMPSTMGKVDLDGNTMTWVNDDEPQPTDTHFYQVSFRVSVPNEPFSALQFLTTQFCGDEELAWGDESPVLSVVPAHAPGWNRYTAQADILAEDFAAFFGDAEIVWTLDPLQAYSPNPAIADLIDDPLEIIPAGSNFWVKY